MFISWWLLVPLVILALIGALVILVFVLGDLLDAAETEMHHNPKLPG